MSPPPPYSFGKPIPVWPVAAISTTTSLTRSRKSAWLIVSASSRIEAYSARLARTRSRTSAYSPSRKARSAGTSTLSGGYAGTSGAVVGVGSSRRAAQRSRSPCRAEATQGRAKKFGVIQ